MKKIFFPLLLIFCLFLSSCFDIYETYTIKEDGSYDISYNMDMAGMMALVNAMATDSSSTNSKLDFEKDTTINLGVSIPDSLKLKLTASEKRVMDNTQLQMVMNKDKFEVGFHNTGNSLNEMQAFFSDFSSAMSKAKAGKMLGSSKMGAVAGDDDGQMVPFKDRSYSTEITSDSFVRKYNASYADTSKTKKQLEIFKKMKVKMSNVIIVNLPRPAKSVDNPKAILSADRKQFKLVIDLLEEGINQPELLSFKINY